MLLSLALCSCAQLGMIDDGTSVSWLRTNGGNLLGPVKLPRHGDGYRIPKRWATRGLNYGTDEMVSLLVHMGREMKKKFPRALIGVADISLAKGGGSAWHRSHQGGRDTDLLIFGKTIAGKRVNGTAMRYFDEAGVTVKETGPKPRPKLRFDVERTWHMVRVALTNPIARVQYMFIYDPLKQQLLDYALRIGEPRALLQQASYVLHQPSDSAKHNDHIHMRIYCSAEDLRVGCIDRGDLRWTKKHSKYTYAGYQSPNPHATVTSALPLPVPVGLTLPFR